MELPIKITFRGTSPSPALEARIRTFVARLDSERRPTACEVVVDNHHRGHEFGVHVVVSIPGTKVIATQADRNAYVAVRDAFRAIKRQLAA